MNIMPLHSQRRSVAVLGAPIDCGNRGVLALGSALVNLCLEGAPEAEVCLLVGNQDDQPAPMRIAGRLKPITVVHARMSPRAHPKHHFATILLAALLHRLIPSRLVRAKIAQTIPWIGALQDALVAGDIRGGDSFSDMYGMKRFILGFLTAATVLLVKGTMVQFPQTYGPYKSRLARWMARLLLRRSAIVMARDEHSRRVAQGLLGPGREVVLTPDVAFYLEPVPPAKVEFSPAAGGSSADKVIGVNVNGLMYFGGYTRKNMFGLKLDYPVFLRRLLETLLREQAGQIWLVPHTFAPEGSVESDPHASQLVWESLPDSLRRRVGIVAGDYDAHEIKAVIGRCDVFFGSRMHACIAALSQGVPCAGVAYSMKFQGVFETVGMGDWVIDARETTVEEAVARAMALFRARDDVRGELGLRAGQARARLSEAFLEVFSRFGHHSAAEVSAAEIQPV